MSPHFFIVSNHEVFAMLLLGRCWSVFAWQQSLLGKKYICVCYQTWRTSSGSFVTMHICVFCTRTVKNTTLHHPSTHSGNDTDPKTQRITAIPYASGSVSRLCVSSFACQRMRSVDSFFVNEGMNGMWQLLVVRHRQAPWVPNSTVRQRVAALKRRDPSSTFWSVVMKGV